jgi:hypothetical protein
VIEVAVSQQQTVDPAKASAAPQQLALRPLSAIQ